MEKLKRYIFGFKKYSYLLRLRITHDIRAKYKNSFLGILWSLFNPLLQMIVMAIVFSTVFGRQIENMPVYIISGRLVFGFFSDSTTGSLMSICVSAPLIKKVYFPKYILVLSKITSSFIILLISLIDLALVMLVTGAPITIYALYAPLYLLLLYIFVVGCGLILSTLNVFFRDMEHLYGIVVLVLMYFSAIFYPVEIIPAQVQKLLIFNPVYHYITGFRYAVYYGLSPDWSNIIYCVGASLAFLIVGILVFKKNQDKFILYI